MITAAVVSSRRVPRIRPRGRGGGVGGVAAHVRHHRDAGLEAGHARGPASGRPAARSPTIISGLPCSVVSALVQSSTTDGWVSTCQPRDDDRRRR